jgi:TolB-like protein/Flp pilus assembly protein TadD
VASIVLMTVALGVGAWRLRPETTPQPAIKTMAVLPFVALNDPNASESQGLGMTDVLITRLSSVKDLKVRPTSAVAALKGQDTVEAGKKLGVDAVLEGMIYRQNGSLRITAKLVRTIDNYVLWAGQFERSSNEELKLQNEIAAQVANILASNLSVTERDAVEKRFTENADAWQTYSTARVEWNKRTWASMLEAQRLFRNAIALDPNFALAYAGLADTLATGPSVDEAEILIEKALELDPSLAEPHASRGFIHMFHRWDWDAAEAAFKRSIELNGNYATAHHWYATLLAIRGRNDEAKAEMQRALELDPLSPNFLADMGQIYYFNREYAVAKELCMKALEQDPEFIFAHEYLHDIYLLTGEYDKAVDAELEAQRVNMTLASGSDARRNRFQRERDDLAALYREKGIAAFEEEIGSRVREDGASYLAATRYVFTGKNNKVLDDLETAYNARGFLTVFLKADPLFDPVRQAPRYRTLLSKMDLD